MCLDCVKKQPIVISLAGQLSNNGQKGWYSALISQRQVYFITYKQT